MPSVVIRPKALEDLAEIWASIAQDSRVPHSFETSERAVHPATIYNSRPATALTTSRKKRLGVRSSAFVPRTSTLGLVPLS